MDCKFHAFMTQLLPSLFRALSGGATAISLAFAMCAPVHAEKADRTKPLNVVADREGNFDLLKQVVVFNGNVTITKGTIVIKADRVEVRERPDGYKIAIAFGSAAKPATFRQKRDGVDEYIDGQADRLEYDEKPDIIRFVNNAMVRRLRGETIGDEITGTIVAYDNTTEVFSVLGGSHTAAGGKNAPGGRVRAVLTPREGTPAAAEAASAAAAAAGTQLKASTSLGDKK
ncbi:MAG: lipopolysaccharide transport periplasmic protein LptA [Burkholderiales bacterium]|nr:lipopolysaccharide transport periplasmic protein LptA [Burkholderiales bacterium]